MYIQYLDHGINIQLHCSCKEGELPTYILDKDTQPVIRAIGVPHTACKDASFAKIFDLTAGGVYFHLLQ